VESLILTAEPGKFEYAKAMGSSSLAQAEPLSLNSTMWIASCTKLITSIAAMQCVEKGLVKLDDDVRAIVPELQNLDILQADADGSIAATRKNDSPITMRYA
jgi:CubicO group peptidase (beta-lactamase class C family)